ncbi:MAG: YodC family protein [Polaribacter sp.]|uniref:YodC family protein n=1 Tax=Polaribacter sp. TaxID=1920175 RepID=UPI003EF58AE7
MPQKFKQGEVVKLKSGGPTMTIEKYKWETGFDYSKESDHVVVCTWFDNDGKLESRPFEQDALITVDNE